MDNIKPIETIYHGYKFRSRLEARWAVYFDALNIKYQYESEGYVLDDGTCYLPDFFLPEVNAYFEVKPASIKGKELLEAREKLERLAIHKNCFAMICRGDPVDNDIRVYLPSMKIWTTAEILKEAEVLDDDMFEYYKAFNAGFVAGYRYSQEDLKCQTVAGEESRLLIPYNTVFSYGSIPYEEQLKARQARFEHGECGNNGR